MTNETEISLEEIKTILSNYKGLKKQIRKHISDLTSQKFAEYGCVISLFPKNVMRLSQKSMWNITRLKK